MGSRDLNASRFTRSSSIEIRLIWGSARARTRASERSASVRTLAASAAPSFCCCTNRYRHCPYLVALIFSHHSRAASLLSGVRADLTLGLREPHHLSTVLVAP